MILENMRLFARVAEARSFTEAARRLGMPKQTLSRRIADLEQTLAVRLIHRTTRRLHLTEAGAAYAVRCAEMVRLAEEANRAVTDAAPLPKGLLRVTADPVFGEAFVSDLVIHYLKCWPETQVEVLLTRRRVNLIEEGFDVAFRVGQVDDPALSGARLSPARIRDRCSPGYLRRRGAPHTPSDLASHDCIPLYTDDLPVRWPFRGAGKQRRKLELHPVSGRLRVSSFAMAHAAALAGLGIAIFPEFVCAPDLARRRLVPVLDDWVIDVGSVWLLHATSRYLSPRVRSFVDLARRRLTVEG